MKNKITFTFIFTLLVVAGLLALYYLPPVNLNGTPLRKVDLLSDLRPDPVVEEVSDSDSIPLPVVAKPVFVDTCKTGMTCIEDYTDSLGLGMGAFYEALENRASLGRPVRIAYFGDSFIEGDILTADLREMLQQKYGGRGVGFVPITSNVSGFRPTVRHTFGGWESHSAMDSVAFDKSRQGVSGHYFIPGPGAYVELKGQNKYASLLDTCRRVSILFYNKGEVTITARVNRNEPVSETFQPTGSLQAMTVEGRIGSVRWTVERADSTLFYGATMDGDAGIAVDNFSLRGTSGLSLRSIPMHTLREFGRERPYDLIVLQYGLNVATELGRNYDKYIAGMHTALEHLKEAFPQAGILIVGVGDRDYKTEEGELRTMPGVKNLMRYQQNLAADAGVAFWNLFEAMGGDCSMVRLVEAKPAMANYDYTHINFRGGKHLAQLLYEALVYGKEQYDRRRTYEEMEP